MDFRKYCEEIKINNAKKHENIIMDLCTTLKNCADCEKCNIQNMIDELNLVKINEKSFRLPDKWENKTNRRFLDIGYKNNYNVKFIVVDNDDYFTEFEAKEVYTIEK